jgi:hypothetical protein
VDGRCCAPRIDSDFCASESAPAWSLDQISRQSGTLMHVFFDHQLRRNSRFATCVSGELFVRAVSGGTTCNFFYFHVFTISLTKFTLELRLGNQLPQLERLFLAFIKSNWFV